MTEMTDMTEIKKEYYQSGELKSEIILINDKKNGAQKTYYKNGQVKQICPYIDDKKDGIEKNYYENGNLWYTAIYVDDKQDGLEKWYSIKDGELCYIRVYINGDFESEVKHIIKGVHDIMF